jgi:hypothetical protein
MANSGGTMDTIHLQGLGKVPAKPVREFQPGEFMRWNYGSSTEVIRVEPKGKMADVYFVGHEHRKPRRMGLDRLAAIGNESDPRS